jgi:hypothetical protein
MTWRGAGLERCDTGAAAPSTWLLRDALPALEPYIRNDALDVRLTPARCTGLAIAALGILAAIGEAEKLVATSDRRSSRATPQFRSQYHWSGTTRWPRHSDVRRSLLAQPRERRRATRT